MVGKSSRLSLPLFWIRVCSRDIFKTIKDTNSSSSSDISWRYSSDWNNRRNFNKHKKIDFSASASGFCYKSEKINSETITTNRVFMPKYKYPYHHFGTNRRKDEQGSFEMSESPFTPSNHCFAVKKRSDVLNCLGSSASSSTAGVFTTATNTVTKSGLFIPGIDSTL